MKLHHLTLPLLLLGIFSHETGLSADSGGIVTPAADTATGQPVINPFPESIAKGKVRLRLQTVTSGLVAPNWGTALTHDPDHLYVGDQNGALWRIQLVTGEKQVFLNLSDKLISLGLFGADSYDERGFLGFAFHPQFAENGLLYTYTSEPADQSSDFSTIPTGSSPNHRSVIREFRLELTSPIQSPAVILSERIVLTVDQPQFNHNGGALNFGPDNMLYIAFGDGGGADDRDSQEFIGNPMIGHGTNGNGQNPANPLGSLLRIDPLGSNSSNGKYGIPSDNPFVGSSTSLAETYAYGFRNPFRFSFDSQTGALIVADVGQNKIEEVDIVQPGGNYGWGVKEGSYRFDPNGGDAGFITDGTVDGNFIDPVVQYDHDEGTAIIGGFMYRGKGISGLQDRYLFGDVAKTGKGDGRIFYSDGTSILELDLTDRDQPGFWVLGFGQDTDGELYALGNTAGIPFGTTGAVYKLVPNASFNSGFLDIPAVSVALDEDTRKVYRARLQVIPNSDPLRLEVISTEELTERLRDDQFTYDQTTGQLILPYVDTTGGNDQVSTYAATLELIPDLPQLTFELKQVTLVK